jgi:hypothetical protein
MAQRFGCGLPVQLPISNEFLSHWAFKCNEPRPPL